MEILEKKSLRKKRIKNNQRAKKKQRKKGGKYIEIFEKNKIKEKDKKKNNKDKWGKGGSLPWRLSRFISKVFEEPCNAHGAIRRTNLCLLKFAIFLCLIIEHNDV